jgi:hypothetical protein
VVVIEVVVVVAVVVVVCVVVVVVAIKKEYQIQFLDFLISRNYLLRMLKL